AVALFSGPHTISYLLVDTTGALTTGVASLSITIGSAVVNTPAATGRLAQVSNNDTGVSITDGITRNTKPVLDGIAEAGSAVAISLNAKTYSTTANSAGVWSISVPDADALADGTYTASIRMTTLGGVTLDSSATPFTVDTVAPSAVTLGVSQTDAVGGDTTKASAGLVQLKGTTEANAIVTISGAATASALASQAGSFQLVNVALAQGVNNFAVTTSDRAGNTFAANTTITRVSSTQADPVLVWNNVALQAIQRDVTDPTIATRILAMQSIAVYDTVAAIEGLPAFMVQRSVSGEVSVEAATTEAAYQVLYYSYPAQRAALDAARAQSLAAITDSAAKTAGIALGRGIAQAIIDIREADGYRDFLGEGGSTTVGKWRPTGPTYLVADQPHWGDVTPFVLSVSDEFRAPLPAALDSAGYAAAVNEV
ncbi:MAG: hypothetical protein JZU63_01625, partial [Rhodoferax sp.]|nr:hypothetical protein [Rhodoferax sp.]